MEKSSQPPDTHIHPMRNNCSLANNIISTCIMSSHEWTAAAKSLQSCPTLCNPIDGSPPGSAIPGILQARTLQWVAISFSNAWKWKVKVKLLSRDPMDCSPPGSSVHGIFQARVLAAAAAKSPQSCPTLCDSIEGSPPGSPVPGVGCHGLLRMSELPQPNFAMAQLIPALHPGESSLIRQEKGLKLKHHGQQQLKRDLTAWIYLS